MRCRDCQPVPEELRRAAELLERRWTFSIVYAAHTGAVRFNEFKHAVGPVPPRTLALRLTELQEAGILERHVVDSRPPRAEYVLTPQGRRLQALLEALQQWVQGREPERA